VGAQRLFPAHAGVIPTTKQMLCQVLVVPRTRGVDRGSSLLLKKFDVVLLTANGMRSYVTSSKASGDYVANYQYGLLPLNEGRGVMWKTPGKGV